MTTYHKEHLSKRVIVLDGATLSESVFEGCTLVYEGGALPILVGSKFNECTFGLGGAAGRTVQYLATLHSSPDFRPIAEATINDIHKLAAVIGAAGSK